MIVHPDAFPSLPEAEEEELDVLDSTIGVTDTSRLACQIDITKALEGAVFTVPDSFGDAR